MLTPALNPFRSGTGSSECSSPSAGRQAPEVAFNSRKNRLSYAFGADMGRDLLRQKEGLNLDLLMQALTDELGGKQLLMTDEEVISTVQTFDREQKLDLQHAAMMIGERNKRVTARSRRSRRW